MKQPGSGSVIGLFLLGVSAFGGVSSGIADPSNMEPASTAQTQRPPTGNPLWGIPIAQLSATRDRPIFSPSRRPPLQPAPVVAVPETPVATPKQSQRPQLALLGTIVNGEDGFGIFMDQAAAVPLRIRIGADHQGWILRRVRRRSATLQKGDESIELVLQRPASDPNAVTGQLVASTGTASTAPPSRLATTTGQAAPPFLSPESASLQMPARRTRSSVRHH